MAYVEVAIAKFHTDSNLFTYESDPSVRVGDIVEVPFGKRKTFGVVVNNVKKPTFKTKKVNQILPYRLPQTTLKLMFFMFDFYAQDYGLITQLFIPSNLLVTSRQKIQTEPLATGEGQPLPKPTIEQKAAIKTISDNSAKRIMLHGDTGTGKTRVFIERINQITAANKSVLVLAPEIGLTPQLVNDLVKHTNAPVLVTHSSLTDTKRRKIWENALFANKPTIFVGPRSALFLPFKNLGLIVIDEAHDASYKQNSAPRYNSLHIASYLASTFDAQLIQSTATPNVDDYKKALSQGYKFIRMHRLAAGDYKGDLHLIDITDRTKFELSPYLSNPLIAAIKEALKSNEQTMLFLNRRGSARLVQCNNCGWQAICPNCGLPLVYHQDFHSIKCHSCSFKQPSPSDCPTCGSTDLVFKSIGTKSLFEHVSRLFKDAKIMRFDADSPTSEQYYKYINELKRGEIDIIIGTQIISKGIDLPYLSVVGVINADSGLNLPDFRAEETTYQQLYQVTGRAQRGHRLSKSFIQTRLVNHPVMLSVFKHSWEDFYTYEISKRKTFKYPPFCFLALLKINRKTPNAAKNNAQKIYDFIKNNFAVETLGPSPSFYEKRGGVYTWQIILKAPRRSDLVKIARQIPGEWIVDIDPTSLL